MVAQLREQVKDFPKRYVDPHDLWSEMLYGLSIALTFTMAFHTIDRTKDSGHHDDMYIHPFRQQ